jgi:peptide/nickel transport system substrate-binding protein
MQKNVFLAFLVPLLLGAILATLGAYVFQMDNLEDRLIRQGNEIRELGDGADRLRGEIQKLTRALESGAWRPPPAPGSTEAAARPTPGPSSPDRQWLHPEVENYLQPHDYVITLPEAEMDGELVRPYGSEPKGFNVIIENAADLQQGIVAYCGLSLADRMAWTDPDRWYGLAAERIEVVNEHKEFTIYLKKGIKWHKPGFLDLDDPQYGWLRGDHYLTAHDLKFSLDILMHPQVENGFAKNYYEDLDSWEVVDDHTFTVRWKKPYYGAIDSTLGMSIIPEFFYAYDEEGTRFPEETLGLRFNQHWANNKGFVGAGPYRMTAYESGVEIRLERNEAYFGELPAIKSIRQPVYSDPDQTLLRLRAHQLTFGGLRPSQYRDEIKKWQDRPQSEWPEGNHFLNGDIVHKIYPGMVYFYLGWNADKALFKDKRARRAMTLAFNRAEIVQSVFEGLGEVAVGPFFNLSPYHDPAIKPLPFDLEQARALLEQAGWEDSDQDGLLDKDLSPDDSDPARQPFEFSLLIYDTSPEIATTANIFKEDLLKIGVRMGIQKAEWSLMQKKMDEKEFDAFTGGWALGWEPDPYQLWHSSQADIPKGSNRVAFRNKEADEIIESLRETFDRDERLRLLRRFHQILHEEQPYTFFYSRKSVACWWKEVQRTELAKIRPHAFSLPWWIRGNVEY